MEETAGEIESKVLTTEREVFSQLFQRQDEDYDRWEMVEPPVDRDDQVVMSKTAAHGTDIVTVSNILRKFADNIQAFLSDAEMDIMIRMAESQGKDYRDALGKLERVFYYLLEKADELLYQKGLPPLRDSLIWHGNIRGWEAARVWVDTDGKDIKPDLMALDPRYLVYERGDEEFLWTGYTTYRSKSNIMAQYGVDVKKERDNKVIDYWKKEDGIVTNGVICDNIFLKEMEDMGVKSIPIIVMPLATRPPIGESSNLMGYGESIFAPARKINAIRNRFITMVASQANRLARQGLINYKSDKGVELDTTTNVPDGVMELVLGENKVEPSPMKEISPTAMTLLSWLDNEIEQATLPRSKMGSPPQSGTLEGLLQQAGNKIFNIQLRTLNNFYGEICRLIEEQIISKKLRFNIQGEEDKESKSYVESKISPTDIKAPHIIKVKFTAQTPWSQMDIIQQAQMLKTLGIPDEWLWEYLLHIQDPKGVKDLALIEMAEHSPELAPKKAIEAMMKYGRVDDAEFLLKAQEQIEAQKMMEMQGGMPQEEGMPPEEAPLPPPPPIGGV